MSTKNGQYLDIEEGVVLFPATTHTTAGAKNGDAIDIGDRTTLNAEFLCTALTGSDTLDCKVQTSKDGSGSGLGAWRDVATFTQLTAAGSERKSFAGLDRFIRVVITPTDAGGGGISATSGVNGDLKG
jgi:hypothetical protein